MFEDIEIDTCFLPKIDFKNIFSSNITGTRKSQYGNICM